MKYKFSRYTYFKDTKVLLSSLQTKTAKKAIYRMENPNKKYYDIPSYIVLGR